MSSLPEGKSPTRVIYEYENGESYEIIWGSLASYLTNIKAASQMYLIHGMEFEDVCWSRIKDE